MTWYKMQINKAINFLINIFFVQCARLLLMIVDLVNDMHLGHRSLLLR